MNVINTLKLIGLILEVLVSIHLCYIIYLFFYGRRHTKMQPVDVLIILGAWLQGDRPGKELAPRIAYAISYLSQHPDTFVIATGGCFRAGQTKSEAQVILEAFKQAGIASNRIFLEEEARTTYENFHHCQNIIAAQLPQRDTPRSIGILTNCFHIKRTEMIARQCGILQPTMLAAPDPRNAVKMYLREAVVIYEVLWKGLLRHISN